jgi:hypothetical protein
MVLALPAGNPKTLDNEFSVSKDDPAQYGCAQPGAPGVLKT